MNILFSICRIRSTVVPVGLATRHELLFLFFSWFKIAHEPVPKGAFEQLAFMNSCHFKRLKREKSQFLPPPEGIGTAQAVQLLESEHELKRLSTSWCPVTIKSRVALRRSFELRA